MKSKKNKNNIKVNLNKINDKSIIELLTDINHHKLLTEEFITPNNSTKKTILKVKDVKKHFGKDDNLVEALRGVSFEIKEGEHLAILGGNGAGKTTISEIIAGLNKPNSGTIEYHLGQTSNFKEKIGIQFQDSSYPVGITVKRVISFIKDVYNSRLSNDKLNALIEIFGIDKFYNKKANGLSGGQQQRLNCLLAIIHNPSLVILDELSTGLDVTVRHRIKTFIKKYAAENNMTILLVSHDMEEVEYIADRIIVMVKGKIFVNATKQEIIHKYGSIAHCIDLYI